MELGSNLFNARKKRVFPRRLCEAGRQPADDLQMGEWRNPSDIRQAKRLSVLYHLTLDELIAFDAEVEEIERVIENTSEAVEKRVDWTKVWGKKYPVLLTYPQTVQIDDYAQPLRELLSRLRREYGYSEVDACLVLKDILAHVWQSRS